MRCPSVGQDRLFVGTAPGVPRHPVCTGIGHPPGYTGADARKAASDQGFLCRHPYAVTMDLATP